MTNRRKRWSFCAACLLTAVGFVLSLHVGKYPLRQETVWALLTGRVAEGMQYTVFWTLRFPRTVMVLLAGLGLGMAGAVYQMIFKNPLASPDIIGVSSGASLGAAVAIVCFGQSALQMTGFAFGGGLLAVLLVMALVRITGNRNTTAYVLAGIIMKAMADALIMMLKFYADPEKQLASIEFWSMGSFGGITAGKVQAMLPLFLCGMVGMVLLRWQITLLHLEEEESRALGVRIWAVRIAVLAFSTLTVASIISFTGLISFIGLIAPHIARLALKRVSFAWCVLSSVVGAFVLLFADCAARMLYSAEIPISILTTLIGIPILLVFMHQRKARRI